MVPRFTEEDRARQKDLLEKEKQLELSLADRKKHQNFQKGLEQNTTILNNLFELILQNHPKVGAKFNIRAGNGDEQQDQLKADVILSAAMQLTMKNKGHALKEEELNDPQLLNNLVVNLVKTMVMNHVLNKNPEIKDVMDNHQKNLNSFADALPNSNNFNEDVALNTLKDGLKNNAPQLELNKALDNLQDETLKNLKGPLNKLFDEAEKMTKTVMDKLSDSIQKEVSNQLNKNFPQLKPGGSSGQNTNANSNDQSADLRENPLANLTGMVSSVPGCIPITISSNIGNGLALITGLRGAMSNSMQNVDAGFTKQSQQTGQVPGFAGEEEGITQFTKPSADSFSSSLKKSSLPNPFSTQLTRDK